jgi:hypothetical protein
MVAFAAIAICDIVGDGDNILLSVVDRMTIKTKNTTVFKNEDDETNILSSPNRTEIGFKLLQDLTIFILGLQETSSYVPIELPFPSPLSSPILFSRSPNILRISFMWYC